MRPVRVVLAPAVLASGLGEGAPRSVQIARSRTAPADPAAPADPEVATQAAVAHQPRARSRDHLPFVGVMVRRARSSARYRVERSTLRLAATSVIVVARSASSRLACSSCRSLIFAGRPPLRPRARAAARPAWYTPGSNRAPSRQVPP